MGSLSMEEAMEEAVEEAMEEAFEVRRLSFPLGPRDKRG